MNRYEIRTYQGVHLPAGTLLLWDTLKSCCLSTYTDETLAIVDCQTANRRWHHGEY